MTERERALGDCVQTEVYKYPSSGTARIIDLTYSKENEKARRIDRRIPGREGRDNEKAKMKE